jgi:hypothetical protein
MGANRGFGVLQPGWVGGAFGFGNQVEVLFAGLVGIVHTNLDFPALAMICGLRSTALIASG